MANRIIAATPVNAVLAFLALLLLAIGASAQKTKEAGPDFDTVDFSKKAELAEWLVRYDQVAWKTTDVAMAEDRSQVAKLGAEWFCFQDADKLWHAVYGKFANGHYDVVFHYSFELTGKISKYFKARPGLP